MSIIRNRRTVNSYITAKVFPADAPINSDGYCTREYISMKGCYLTPMGDIKVSTMSSIIFKVEIASDAQGYIFGANDSLNIQVGNGNITWNCNTTLHTMAIPTGVHEIGFVRVQGGVKPIVDNAFPNGANTANNFDARNFKIGTAVDSQGAVTGSAITASGTFAIKVHEVIGYLAYTDGNDTSYHLMHWYACNHTSNEDTPFMYETRAAIAIANTTLSVGGSGTATLGNHVAYGVQLFDLREITGSGYRDLTALVADDEGVDTVVGWYDPQAQVIDDTLHADAPSVMIKNEDTRNFALSLSGLPKPSDWTYYERYPEQSGGQGYEAGELHRGRRPKWDIWNDCIKFGFYVHDDSGTKTLRFNFLKIINVSGSAGTAPNLNTVDGKCWLEWFNGYNTDPANSHPPRIQVDNNILDCFIYNGAFSRCLANDTFAGSQNFYDNMRIFLYNDTVGGNINYRAGNLLPWNWTKAQLQRYGYTFSRMALVMTLNPGDIEYINDYVEVQADAQGDKIISADTPSAEQLVFRSTGKTASTNLVDANKWHLFDQLMEAPNHELTMKATMTLKSGSDDVSCSRLMPSKFFKAKGHFDENIVSGATDYRCIIDLSAIDQTGQNAHIGVVGREQGTVSSGLVPLDINTKYVSNGSPSYSCLFIPITRCKYNQSAQIWEPIYNETTDPSQSGYVKYRALIEVYRKSTISAATQYNHYIRLVKSINGMQAFKNYCDFGDPTASSALQDWAQQSSLFMQCWGYSSTAITANHFIRLWCEGTSWYFPLDTASTPSDARTNALPNSTRVFVVPREMLWASTVGELDENITVLAHILPEDTTNVYSALYGDSFSALRHQKYNVDESFFADTVIDVRGASLTYVSTETFYTRTTSDTDSIYALFRAYTRYGDTYSFCEDILYEIGDIGDTGVYFYVELYKVDGNTDYAALVNGNYHREGTKVATFTVKDYSGGHGSNFTSNGYVLTINASAGKPSNIYFHPWGDDIDSDPFFEFRIKNASNSNAIEAGCLYYIRLVGPGND